MTLAFETRVVKRIAILLAKHEVSSWRPTCGSVEWLSAITTVRLIYELMRWLEGPRLRVCVCVRPILNTITPRSERKSGVGWCRSILASHGVWRVSCFLLWPWPQQEATCLHSILSVEAGCYELSTYLGTSYDLNTKQPNWIFRYPNLYSLQWVSSFLWTP